MEKGQAMKITIVINGGNVQGIYAPDGTEIELIDFDNPSKGTINPDGETCPQEIIEEIETKIRTAEGK
jgi:hypothetical protein